MLKSGLKVLALADRGIRPAPKINPLPALVYSKTNYTFYTLSDLLLSVHCRVLQNASELMLLNVLSRKNVLTLKKIQYPGNKSIDIF